MFDFIKRARQALTIEAAMISHVGAVRVHNEDMVSFVVLPRQDGARSETVLGVVADGMGGHAAGEVASEIAVEACLGRFRQVANDASGWLRTTLLAADASVKVAAQADLSRTGMGTTIALVLVREGRLYTGHVGDCRIYRLRNGALKRLTRDHSLVAEWVARGELSEDAARHHPKKNIVLQAIGQGQEIVPEVSARGHALECGDRILVCSDGLTDALTDLAIASCLRNADGAGTACKVLCHQALKAGAPDNVSIGVFDVHRLAAASAPLSETGDIFIEGAPS
ncbi:MAG: protein phosphatase 2C domain-containing protein [Pseudomonadota bacterium]